MGLMNYHIEIEGWDNLAARIRRINATPPPSVRDYIYQSKVVSLKFLERISVLALRVFEFSIEGTDNPADVG
jgi:hypothetical protein